MFARQNFQDRNQQPRKLQRKRLCLKTKEFQVLELSETNITSIVLLTYSLSIAFSNAFCRHAYHFSMLLLLTNWMHTFYRCSTYF